MISIAYIVRDEILKLPFSYDKMRGFTDDIVIVDTGSKDGTYEWIKSRPVTYDKIKWNDDYAQARNHSLSLCKYPWVLIIDADEYIEDKYFNEIRNLIKNTENDAFKFTIWNFLEDPRWTKTQPIYGMAIRLFKNNGEIKYEGCVHNKLAGYKSEKIVRDIPVCHYQFHEREIYKEKAQKNLKLLKKKVEQEGWNFLNAVHHGDIFRRLFIWYGEKENLIKAIHYFEKALTFENRIAIIKTVEQCKEILNGIERQSRQMQANQ